MLHTPSKALSYFPWLPKTKSKMLSLASELYLVWPSSTFKTLSPIPSKHQQSCPLAKLIYLLLTIHVSVTQVYTSHWNTCPLCSHLPSPLILFIQPTLKQRVKNLFRNSFLIIPYKTYSIIHILLNSWSLSYFNLGLSFSICKTIIIIPPTSYSFIKIRWAYKYATWEVRKKEH